MNNEDIEKLKNMLLSLKAECGILLKTIDEKEEDTTKLKSYLDNLQKARAIIAETGKYTQSYLKEYIESMVTTALQAVFEEDYQFVINFNIKRNRPESSISLKIRGEEVSPDDAVGGGVLDVAAFALRVVLWSIESPRSTNTIVLDEPMKFLHSQLLIENTVKMLKDLSNKMNLQFIIVSQIEDISENADKTFIVKHNGKFSEVKERDEIS